VGDPRYKERDGGVKMSDDGSTSLQNFNGRLMVGVISLVGLLLLFCICLFSYGFVYDERNVTITKIEGDMRSMIVGTTTGEVFMISPEIWAKLDIGKTYNVKVNIPVGDMPRIVDVNYQVITNNG
jgi:hypothetical protein